jgi:hypothetical protein
MIKNKKILSPGVPVGHPLSLCGSRRISVSKVKVICYFPFFCFIWIIRISSHLIYGYINYDMPWVCSRLLVGRVVFFEKEKRSYLFFFNYHYWIECKNLLNLLIFRVMPLGHKSGRKKITTRLMPPGAKPKYAPYAPEAQSKCLRYKHK